MFDKILYFGAGTHLEPTIHFPNTKEFIFGDSQPKTEFGCFNVYKKEFYRKFFLPKLEDKIKELGFYVQYRKILTNKISCIQSHDLESECLFLTNKPYNLRSATHIKYYISTSLPYDLYNNPDLQSDIETCDTLLISRHHPDIKIINYLKKPFNLIAYSGTWFPFSLENLIEQDCYYKNNIMLFILNNPHLIKSYTVVDEQSGEKIFLKSYNDLYEKIKELVYKSENVFKI